MSDIWKDAPEGTEYSYQGNWWKTVNGIMFRWEDKKLTDSLDSGYHWARSPYTEELTEKMTPRPETKPEELTLLEENTRQYKISNIGNILHNMSCSMDDDNEQNELGGYASFMWDLADWFRDSAVGCSKDKPVFTQAMADAGTLPLVGMECLIYSYDSPAMLDKKSWHKTRVLSIDSDLHSSVVVTYTCKWNADFYVDCRELAV